MYKCMHCVEKLMSISQRLSKRTKKKLDEIQARFILDKDNGHKVSIPDLIEKMTEFVEEHMEQFKEKLSKASRPGDSDAPGMPEFLKITVEANKPGSPEDYKEYDYDDI